MGEVDYEYLAGIHSPEALILCSINERFDNEIPEVKAIREMYVTVASNLISLRNSVGRSEAGRNYSIAITDLENSCIRAVKGLYSPKLPKLED